MELLQLLQETVDIVDENIVVCQGLQVGMENDFFSRHEPIGQQFINIPLDIQEWSKDIDTPIWSYAIIDYGFDYTDICDYKLFVFFHELGHLVNGLIENELIYVARIAQLPQSKPLRAKGYIKIPDEWYAWLWAWDFISTNKEYVRKLNSQLNW